MRCIECGSAGVTERPERTAQGYRRFRCRQCGKQFNERSGTVLNRAQYPSDVIALVVLWRLRYKLSLRDLPEMLALRGMVFSCKRCSVALIFTGLTALWWPIWSSSKASAHRGGHLASLGRGGSAGR